MRSLDSTLALLALLAVWLPAAPARAADENCVNAGCHGDFGKAPFTHDAMDTCTDCHKLVPGRTEDLHQAKAKQPSKAADFKVAKKTPDLCFDCHDNDGEKVDTLHSPYEDGDCLACHNPHQSKQAKLVKKPIAESCYECHDEMQEKVEGSRVAHDPMDSKEACITCHKPHGGNAKAFLKGKSVQGLCGEECHDDIVAEIETVPVEKRHGPLKKGECQACHDVHGSPFASLLRGNFPAGMYAPWSSNTYKACFGKCHDNALFGEKGASAFSDAQKNLHALHVNRDKGRSCRMCHEPHASGAEHLIKQKVPFGKWKFDMNWKPGQPAASCAPACHGEKSYDGALKAKASQE
jgi:predicted CXXCH cytochrome family protein